MARLNLIVILLCLLLVASCSIPKRKEVNYSDGVCIFYRISPEQFEFVKFNGQIRTNGQLIHLLQKRTSAYLSPPYRGYINNRIFESEYMDTLSYGYNTKGDDRLTKIYYCNCRLYSKEFSHIDMDSLFFDYSSFPFASKYEYTYMGEPIRFHSEVYFLKIDSICFDRR